MAEAKSTPSLFRRGTFENTLHSVFAARLVFVRVLCVCDAPTVRWWGGGEEAARWGE